MKNKKLYFVLLAFIFIGLASVGSYVYLTFFFGRDTHAENQRVFEETVDLISLDIDKNLHLYASRFESILADDILKLFVKNLLTVEYHSREDRDYISNLVRRGSLNFSSISLYENDGSVIFSFFRNNRNSTIDNKRALNQERFWDKVIASNKDVVNIYSYEDNAILSVGRIRSGGEILGYLVLAIPNSIFNISSTSGSGNYKLTDSAVLYYTNELEDRGYHVVGENIDRLLNTTDKYVVLSSVPYKIYISPNDNGVITVAAAIKDEARTRKILEYIVLAIFVISLIAIGIFGSFFLKGLKSRKQKDEHDISSENEINSLLDGLGDAEDNMISSLLSDDDDGHEIEEVDLDISGILSEHNDEEFDLNGASSVDGNLDQKGDDILHDITDMSEDELDKLWDEETAGIGEDETTDDSELELNTELADEDETHGLDLDSELPSDDETDDSDLELNTELADEDGDNDLDLDSELPSDSNEEDEADDSDLELDTELADDEDVEEEDVADLDSELPGDSNEEDEADDSELELDTELSDDEDIEDEDVADLDSESPSDSNEDEADDSELELDTELSDDEDIEDEDVADLDSELPSDSNEDEAEKELDINSDSDLNAEEEKENNTGSQDMEEENKIETLDGSTIDDELLKKEDAYFSSDDAFDFDGGSDFLNILDKEEVNDTSSEDVSDSIKEDEQNTDDDVPKIPDDYYNQSSNAQSWNKLIDDSNFLMDLSNESFEDIIKLAREKLDMNIDKALYLKYDSEDKIYKVSDSTGVENDSSFTIDPHEAFYTKLVAKNNIISIDNPMESDIIKSKFSETDYSGIDKLVIVPLENEDHDLYKNFFITLGVSNL